MGHIENYYRNKMDQGASGTISGGASKFYTLDAKKAKDDSELIAGTCYMHGKPLFVLYDCGESYSFISTKCLKRLEVEVIPLPSPMVVTTAMGSNVETQWIMRELFDIC